LFHRGKLPAYAVALDICGQQQVALLVFANVSNAQHGRERKAEFHD
jgi:hypothetical protein